MHFKKNKKWILAATLFVIIIGIIIDISEFFYPIERQVLDFKFQTRDRAEQADTNIVFIAIDDKSLTFFNNQKVSWPWPRILYSKVIDFLSSAGAKSIILDIDFSSKLNDSEDEQVFINSIKNSGNVFLISILSKDTNSVLLHDLSQFSINSVNKFCSENYSSIILPPESYLNSNINLGIVNLDYDEDGIVRNACFAYNFNGMILPSLPLAVFMSLSNNNSKPNSLPVNKRTINWYGAGGPGGSYKYYSIASVILSQIKLEKNLSPIINKSVFQNKIVFIGGTASSLLDYKATPMNKFGIAPAMEIHATVLNNLLHNDFLYNLPSVVIYLVNIILIVLIFYFIIKSDNIFKGILLSILPVLVLVLLSILLFEVNIEIPIVNSIINGSIALISSLVLVYVFEGKEKRELKQVFSKYVSPAIVDEIIKKSNEIDLQGKEVVATVFFSDIQGFTSISEKLEPKELVHYLNLYFESVSNVILDHNAMLDKYIGDGIMAIFGAPLLETDHALQACEAALIISKELSKIKFEDNMPVFKTRIGLNTGKMIIGNIGTKRRMDYTAIGDSVNLSSRLESLNKAFGTNILVSESTVNLCKEKFLFREIDMIAVKGKDQAVKVYELIDSIEGITHSLVKFKNIFEDGVHAYRNKEWDKAIQKFNDAQKLRPSDKACQVYINRCNNFISKPPDENWDGVFYATTKY